MKIPQTLADVHSDHLIRRTSLFLRHYGNPLGGKQSDTVHACGEGGVVAGQVPGVHDAAGGRDACTAYTTSSGMPKNRLRRPRGAQISSFTN